MYRVRHQSDPIGVEFSTATQAIRGMARAVRALPLNRGERKAFAHWYTYRNYRGAAVKVRQGHRYEIAVSVRGERQTFVIEPPPPRGQPETPTPVVRLALVRDGSETPHHPPL